ncbi:MAG: SgcJ/EcaC family oxidoreductase [Actinomycetota bacterium]
MRKSSRLVPVVALLVCLSATCVLATHGNADDMRKDDVRKAVEGFATDWNHHDMDAFGKLFAPDAEFVNVIGIVMKGRQEIQMHHAWAHGAIPKTTQVPGAHAANYGIFKDSTMKFESIDVRFLRNDVALAHVKWQLLRDVRTTTPRRGVLLFVLTHGKNRWLIASGQNTEINRTVK